MKRYGRTVVITAVVFLALASALNFFIVSPHSASACGLGRSGGADFVPQRRTDGTDLAAKSALTQEQAREIVANHIQKLNPSLEVGNINDNGSFYETEILSEDREVIQVLGVDKFSGRLMPIN